MQTEKPRHATRLRELDFLRGIAILLVLINHIPLFTFTRRMGWIGVDLFFVLSGFLVSGLLFKEYARFGNIRPKLFLIRRGFKIYPIYYLFYIPYLLLVVYQDRFHWRGFLSDMTFTQNYVQGWGFAYSASWSLAVEEHFYFGFALLLYLFYAVQKKPGEAFSTKGVFAICGVMALCLLLRIMAVPVMVQKGYVALFTPTHFRIDALMMGVLIAYFYHFRYDVLVAFFNRNRFVLLVFAGLSLLGISFIERTSQSAAAVFLLTMGLSLVYLSFGIVLVACLLTPGINSLFDKWFSRVVVDLVSRVGFCSYSIYIIHTLVIRLSRIAIAKFHLSTWHLDNRFVFFIFTAGVSILCGMVMTYTIEKRFLAIRDAYFPARV
jgi:peptidoglycan/LPS O-acetylase OafA/YrhL